MKPYTLLVAMMLSLALKCHGGLISSEEQAFLDQLGPSEYLAIAHRNPGAAFGWANVSIDFVLKERPLYSLGTHYSGTRRTFLRSRSSPRFLMQDTAAADDGNFKVTVQRRFPIIDGVVRLEVYDSAQNQWKVLGEMREERLLELLPAIPGPRQLWQPKPASKPGFCLLGGGNEPLKAHDPASASAPKPRSKPPGQTDSVEAP